MQRSNPLPRLKVVLLSQSLGPYTIMLANGLSPFCDVTLMIPDLEVELHRRVIDQRINIREYPQVGVLSLRNLPFIFYLWRCVNEIKPDIIHLQNGHIWFCFVLPFLWFKYPIVTTIHDPWLHSSGKERLVESISTFITRKFSDVLIVHSVKFREYMLSKYSLKPAKVFVTPLGEMSFYKAWCRNGLEEIDHQVLFFGRISEYKGLEYLIKAEPLIKKEIPDVKIVIAGRGGGMYYEKIMNMIGNNNSFMIYHEFISNEFLAELFQKASIIVLPYTDASQSAVLAIAYGFRKPVVATDVGAISDVVEHEKTGLLVPARDVTSLSQAIIKLLKDKKLRLEMGENAYQKTLGELSWQNIAGQTIEIYRNCLNNLVER